MLRKLLYSALLVLISAAALQAQVQTVGDVSFAIPSGWTYQRGRDFGAITMKADTRFWLVAVYTSMPSGGDANADFRAAWKRVVLTSAGYRTPPGYDPYNVTGTVGYSGKYYDGTSDNQATYTRLYTLETGKVCVPVAFVSTSRQVLDGMAHNAMAVIGSVRVAPLQAVPIKYSITVADLAGQWTIGIVNSTNFYNSNGQYHSSSLTAIKAEYDIAPDGRYSYKSGGLLNNRTANYDDSGIVELKGEFVNFKGQKETSQNRFVNLQQALDGSTVLTLWPAIDMSKIDSNRDSMYWTRAAKK